MIDFKGLSTHPQNCVHYKFIFTLCTSEILHTVMTKYSNQMQILCTQLYGSKYYSQSLEFSNRSIEETLTCITVSSLYRSGIMAIKRYCTFLRVPELETHHLMQFIVTLCTSLWGVLLHSRRYWRQSRFQKQEDAIIYLLSDLIWLHPNQILINLRWLKMSMFPLFFMVYARLKSLFSTEVEYVKNIFLWVWSWILCLLLGEQKVNIFCDAFFQMLRGCTLSIY